MPNRQKIIIILGPTSSGKTKLAVKLAKKFNGEIISADSRQVYLGMDLGTGKEGRKKIVDGEPSRVLNNIPQYLIDIKKPEEQFSVSEWQKSANQLIEKISQKGKIPLIVGGTGLYLTALTEGFSLPPATRQSLILRKKLEKKPLADLLAKLKTVDPKTYQKIDHHNKRRITRALEVSLTADRPFSELTNRTKPPYQILKIGLQLPRPLLYSLIDQRLDKRIRQGLIQEVKKLHQAGLSWPRLESFGLEYRWTSLFLQGKITREEMTTKLKFASHHLAKRQLTWWRRDKAIHWINNETQAKKLIKSFLDIE